MKRILSKNPLLNLAQVFACLATLGTALDASAELVLIGPPNGNIENIDTQIYKPVDWFYAQNAQGFVNAVPGSGNGGSGGVGIGSNDATGIADLRSKACIVTGSSDLSLSFDYRFLPDTNGAPNPAGSMLLQLRFFDATNASGEAVGQFLGEVNVEVKVDSSNTSVDFTNYAMSGIAVPAGAVSADIRLSANIFLPNFVGWANFDNFAVSAPVQVPVQELVIKSSVFDFDTMQVQLTWTSIEGNTYSVSTSPDLMDWSNVLVSGIPAAVGSETSTTVSFTPETQGFFRIEQE